MVEQVPVSEGFGKHPPMSVEEAKKKWKEKQAKVEKVDTVVAQTPALTPWQWATAAFAILSVVFLAGYLSKDTYVQDRIETIQKLERVKKTNDFKIEELKKASAEADAGISKASGELKSRGVKYEK